MNGIYGGFKVIANEMLTVSHTETFKRTMKERWLSLNEKGKWRPFQSKFTVTTIKPDNNLIILADKETIVAHPATIERMMEALKTNAQFA